MKFKVDENLPGAVKDLLRQARHEAETVAGQGLSGARDEKIIEACAKEQRVLVTLDLDFANVIAYPPKEHSGIMVFRLRRQDAPSILLALRRVIPLMQEGDIRQRLWIVEESRIRIHGSEKD